MSKAPKLRFKEFSGDWEHKHLDKIVERVTRKNKGTISKLPLTISAQYGLVDQETFFNKTVASKNLEGYYLLENGEFAYNKSYSNGYPWGAIKRLDRYDKGVLSSLYICFRILDKASSDYIKQYFETSKWYKEVSMIAVEGARNHGLLNISVSDFFDTLHYIPSKEEQEKIAYFLSLIDDKISLQGEKVEALKDYKKGMMQKIFSRELRFKDDEGRDYPEWEHKKLNRIVERITRKNKGTICTLPLTISAQYGLVDQVTFFNKTVASANLEGYYLLEKGEFAYNKSYSTGYPFGAIKRLDRYDRGVLSSLYICFSILEGVDSDFLVQYFETSCWHKEISMIAVEGARNHGLLNISVSDFFETYHWIPCYDEQVKIGEFLGKIDEKINKEQDMLDSLNEYKKGLLQQMFV
ncbi:restriction endonuclease subunit S [Romboutsia ilealis]|uniref:restriction endonuclease subunit S n=1 Tax=Romboutsia ilealis TaxID=1115758 RepID=UPI002675EF07|nr:restriction endonuclease subunit S [Romboutsia ilealis]